MSTAKPAADLVGGGGPTYCLTSESLGKSILTPAATPVLREAPRTCVFQMEQVSLIETVGF